jgi:hypothetical protein
MMSRDQVLPLGKRGLRVDRRMIFSTDRNALYVSVPKTGCTTIKTVVAAAFGLVEPKILDKPTSGNIQRTFMDRDSRWSRLTDDEREDMLLGSEKFRFTSVRNPYERIISCYLDKVVDQHQDYNIRSRISMQGEVSMLSFLRLVAEEPPLKRDIHYREMVELSYADDVTYTDIIRYETFEHDLRRIMERLNSTGWPIPKPAERRRTFAASHIESLLGTEECALIQSIYRRDFETFGYSHRLSAIEK